MDTGIFLIVVMSFMAGWGAGRLLQWYATQPEAIEATRNATTRRRTYRDR